MIIHRFHKLMSFWDPCVCFVPAAAVNIAVAGVTGVPSVASVPNVADVPFVGGVTTASVTCSCYIIANAIASLLPHPYC